MQLGSDCAQHCQEMCETEAEISSELWEIATQRDEGRSSGDGTLTVEMVPKML